MQSGDGQEPRDEQLRHLRQLYTQGHVQEALARAEQLLERHPKTVEIWFVRGAASLRLRLFDRAIESYRQAQALEPDSAEIHYNIGTVLKAKGELEAAIASFRKSIRLKPWLAQAHYNLGNALKDKGNLDAAIESYKKALEEKPDHVQAYNNMAAALQDQGNLEAAKAAYAGALRIQPDNANARHHLAALSGFTPKSIPSGYVEKLFDKYAENFETSLQQHLDYRTPKLITQMMMSQMPDASLGRVLDLGCGTGLAGLELQGYVDRLTGVDLSRGMLDIAREKGLYDELAHDDILRFLAERELDFDYLVATDVLIYFGDLSEIFSLIKSRNKRPARLVFSTEHMDGTGYRLEQTGRYAHSRSYIEDLCEKFGYDVVEFKTCDLRKEKGVYLTGGLYMLAF
jgi:predicted TPR repeat methyltransferase